VIEYNPDAYLNPMSTFKGMLVTFYYMTVPKEEWGKDDADLILMMRDSDNEATTRIFRKIQEYIEGKVMTAFLDFVHENGMSSYYMYSWEYPDAGYTPSVSGKDLACFSYFDKAGNEKKTTVASDCEKATSTKEMATFYSKLYNDAINTGHKITQDEKDKVMEKLKLTLGYGFEKSMDGEFYTKGGSHAYPPNDWPHNVFDDAGIIKTDKGDFAFAAFVMDCETPKLTSDKLVGLGEIISKNII